MANILSPRIGHAVASSSDDVASSVDHRMVHDTFHIDLEDVSKPRPRGRTYSDTYATLIMWVSPREIAAVVIGLLTVALVLDPPFVVYFLALSMTTVSLASRIHSEERHISGRSHPARHVWLLAGCVIVAGGFLLRFFQQFEIEHIRVDIDLPALSVIDTRPSVTFFRMYNPRLPYNSDIEAIHNHLNNGTVKTQRLAVDPSIDVWTSDVFRYEFLQRAWHWTVDDDTYRVLCIAESDVVYDEQYVASQLLPSELFPEGLPQEPLELAHVQHFWGHRVFEPFNIALLCTSSHASPWTQYWVQLASFLHRKRYRRLLPLDLLFALVPNRLVLYWDAHHGCTNYDPRCKYIHFTQPKITGILEASHRVRQEQEARVGSYDH